MAGIAPNFDDWRRLSSIKVWEIAALIHGFDPRAAGDVAVQDPDDPDSRYGVPPDTTWEERAVISAVETGILLSAPTNVTSPDIHTKISMVSLLPWLQAQGYDDLAAKLGTTMTAYSMHGPLSTVPQLQNVSDPERRLKALRDLGGDAKWTRYRGQQQWRFKKIKELVAQEKHAVKPRSDEKTIRKDLTDAAEAESIAKKRGVRP
jgi:hypothetical protein